MPTRPDEPTEAAPAVTDPYAEYELPVDRARVEALGVDVIDAELVDPRRPGRIDADRLTELLLAFARTARASGR